MIFSRGTRSYLNSYGMLKHTSRAAVDFDRDNNHVLTIDSDGF